MPVLCFRCPHPLPNPVLLPQCHILQRTGQMVSPMQHHVANHISWVVLAWLPYGHFVGILQAKPKQHGSHQYPLVNCTLCECVIHPSFLSPQQTQLSMPTTLTISLLIILQCCLGWSMWVGSIHLHLAVLFISCKSYWFPLFNFNFSPTISLACLITKPTSSSSLHVQSCGPPLSPPNQQIFILANPAQCHDCIVYAAWLHYQQQDQAMSVARMIAQLIPMPPILPPGWDE